MYISCAPPKVYLGMLKSNLVENQLCARALIRHVEAEAIQTLVQGLGLAVECSSGTNGLSSLDDDNGILAYSGEGPDTSDNQQC